MASELPGSKDVVEKPKKADCNSLTLDSGLQSEAILLKIHKGINEIYFPFQLLKRLFVLFLFFKGKKCQDGFVKRKSHF